jgi:NNP family nitrate/nitrite transporter-like MFS transporter
VDRILLTALALGLQTGFTMLAMPPAVTDLMSLYGVSYTGISILLSALFWSHAAVQIPGGMITDRMGLRKTLLLAQICFLFGTIVPLFHVSLPLAVTGRVLSGIGSGLTFVAGLKFISTNAPPNRTPVYQSAFGSCIPFGGICAFAVIPYLLRFSWWWAFLIPGLAALLMIPAVLTIKMSDARQTSSLPALKEAVRLPVGWVLGLVAAVSYGGFMTVGNWTPSLLADAVPDIPAHIAAWGGAAIMLTGGIARLSGGFTLLRFSHWQVIKWATAFLTLAFLGLSLSPAAWAALLLGLGVAWFGSVTFAAFFHVASLSIRPEAMGTLFGFINLLANVGAVGFIIVFGTVRDATGSFAWGFGIMAAVTAIAYGTVQWLQKRTV